MATSVDGAGTLTLADASLMPDNNFNLIHLLAAWAVIYGHSHALSVWGGDDLVVRLIHFKFSGGIAVDVCHRATAHGSN